MPLPAFSPHHRRDDCRDEFTLGAAALAPPFEELFAGCGT
jgi:hypothetical protein